MANDKDRNPTPPPGRDPNSRKKPPSDEVQYGGNPDPNLDLGGNSDPELDLAGMSDDGLMLPDVPLGVEEVEPVAEAAPASEIFPIGEPEAFSGEPPAAGSASASSPSGFWGGPVPSPSGSSSDLFGEVPIAEPVSGVDSTLLPADGLFGKADSGSFQIPAPSQPNPPGGGPESEVFPLGAQPAAADSGSFDVRAAEPLSPVEPASGWLDSQPGDQPSPPELHEVPPPADPKASFDVIEAGLADPLPRAQVDSSDIFATPTPPAEPKSDVSDVIAATAFGPDPAASFAPTTPAQAGEVPPAHPSDVALTFDQPPGGSTLHDPAAEADLPVADEVPLGEIAEPDPLFGGDSAHLADAPDLPFISLRDDTDPPVADASHILADLSDPEIRPPKPLFGRKDPGRPAPPARPVAPPRPPVPPPPPAQNFISMKDDSDGPIVDASSIMADLSDPDSELPGESSAIRLEAPGTERTLSGKSQRSGFLGKSTEPDVELPESSSSALAGGGKKSGGGSDLFSDSNTMPAFDLVPDAGLVDPFGSNPDPDAQSSIFSGDQHPVVGSTGSKSGVPDAVPESTDAVEFSDHPNPEAADSGSFHVSGAGAGDFAVVENIDLGGPGVGPAEGGSASSIFHGDRKSVPDFELLPDPSGEAAPAPAKKKKGKDKPAATPPAPAADPSLVVDWLAPGSAEEEVPAEVKPEPAAPRERKRDRNRDRERPTKPAKAGGRGLAGLALGLLLGLGAAAGAYFSGLLPARGDGKQSAGNVPRNPVAPPANAGQGPPAAAVAGSVADAHAAIAAGDPDRAVKMMQAAGASTPEEKAALGQARFFARLRELGLTNANATADDAALKEARADLEAAANDPNAAKTPEGEKVAVRAALHLGLTHELAGDRAKAKQVYADGIKKFPNSAAVFQAALDRLAATDAGANNSTSIRLTPAEAEQLAAAVVVLLALDAAPPAANPAAAEPAEAGPAFWKAVNLAAAGKYDDAIKQLAGAKAAHQKRAKFLAGRGLNPLSDPLEQIFPKCCDELTASWELRKSLYGHPGIGAMVKKDGVAKALDQLAAAEKRSVELAKINAILAADLKTEKAKVLAAEKDLKAEKDKLAVAATREKDLKAMFDKQTDAFKADIEAAKKDATKFKELADAEKLENRKLADSLKVSNDALTAIGKELQGGKLLPAKYDDKELLSAAKSAVSRATGPDLTKLIPPDLSAVAGTGLTTGHLVQLAARVNKAEANATAAAAAATKLKEDHEAAVAKLNETYKADLKKINDTHAAEVKKLTDASAADLKKLADANATAADKLKADHAAKLKELADKHAADVKKLTDAQAAKVKALETDLAAERLRVGAIEKRFKAEMALAFTPSQQLDLWLALLTELRRPADAAPALDVAAKALKTAEPGSEDAGKAATVAGLALLLKNDPAAAKEMFAAAKLTPAYLAAKGKPWAHAAETGLAAITDPAAHARRPLDPAPGRNPAAATRFLDAGIIAYKAGRYAAAEKALAEAAWHDPNDALAWYFLGAARWQAHKFDQAKADFQQGAAREQARTVPARVIDEAISPIQGPARSALTAARP